MRFFAQRCRQRRLIDEIAARQIDEEGVRLHTPQRRLPDQVSVCSLAIARHTT